MPAADGAGTYEERLCWRCDRGRVYEEGTGWVPCPWCFGKGWALAFVYPKRSTRRIRKKTGVQEDPGRRCLRFSRRPDVCARPGRQS